ncbi:MAG TPA: YbhB/YbcL family Raf kinase inhibitor-like protein [Parvularculaceae bacterium]|nr:YbhB/YbcL family Raf kinase inhibitor-like protein [Parvularculaceae bacterium]
MNGLKVAFILLIGALFAPAAAMDLKSADLDDGGKIALEQVYTRCGGQNIAPQLSWSGAPAGTQSFALTLIDQSVKPNKWSHWIVVGIPATFTSLAKAAPLPAGARNIVTNFGGAGYNGPCPPAGSGPHRYQFTIWALRGPAPPIGDDAKADEVEAALEKVALDKATLSGDFERN